MSIPKVSIVIVNWNNLSDTLECLESIQKISYSNYEVVMVDNGSDGDDAKLLNERFGDSIRLIENEKNYGFAEGCNIGMNEAINRGADYVLLLNNDTIVDTDFLSEIVKTADSDVRIGIAGGMIYCYESPQIIWFAGGGINFWTGITPIRGTGETDRGQFEEIVEVNWICGCFMLISRNLLQDIGMLDKRFFFGWEDVDLCIRAARKGFKVIFVPGSKIWHKAVPPGKRERLLGRPLSYAARGYLLFLEKHFTKLQLLSTILYITVMFPRVIIYYSRTFGHWKVLIYILKGYLSFFWIKCRKLLRREQSLLSKHL